MRLSKVYRQLYPCQSVCLFLGSLGGLLPMIVRHLVLWTLWATGNRFIHDLLHIEHKPRSTKTS
jgi:hypothetical protein